MACEAPVAHITAAAYEIPTDGPEADGTLEWDHTVLVVVEIEAADQTGLGYTYADGSIVTLIQSNLGSVISGYSAFDIAAANKVLWRSIRNLGRSGLVAMTEVPEVGACELGRRFFSGAHPDDERTKVERPPTARANDRAYELHVSSSGAR